LEGRPVIRFPQQLRIHRALEEFGWMGEDELNTSAQQTRQSVTEPIMITTNGTILAGFGRWWLAMSEDRDEVPCIEYGLNEDESLQFILTHHQIRRGWNDFVRIRLALSLESNLQQRALDNMRTGGRCKGSANLSEADRVEVRREIANAAGTGTGNVDKVKAILRSAHPNIVAALQNGSLRIHRAWKWCKFSKSQQKEEFADYEEGQIRRKILREFGDGQSRLSFDRRQVLEALQLFETRHPGQIVVRDSSRRETVIILGQDVIEEIKTTEDANQNASASRSPKTQFVAADPDRRPATLGSRGL
jgi:hypothetical protein